MCLGRKNMNYSQKAKQWENRELNRYLGILDREEEGDGVYNDDYDWKDEEWEYDRR